jgi:hypothetical protein
MPDYGTCTQCGKEIDPHVGYSNVGGVNERLCLPCQFPGAAHKQRKAIDGVVIHRKQASSHQHVARGTRTQVSRGQRSIRDSTG